MIRPIYKEGTILYGNDGTYKLLKKEDGKIVYEFEPWPEKRQIRKETIEKVSERLNMRLVWAVWDDIPDIN